MTGTDRSRRPDAKSGRAVIGRCIVRKAVVESTMDEAWASAREGAAEGLVILAGEQRAGRGRYGRRWVSAQGGDVLMSALLRPDERVAGQLLMMAALAGSRAVDALTGVRSTIKWPNDVRVEGRKVCGVLAESESGPEGVAAVVGIGLNVNSGPPEWPDDVAGTATSLCLVAGRPIPTEDAVSALLDELDALYGCLRSGGSVRDAWAERLDTIGSEVEVAWRSEAGVAAIKGRAEGVDEAGRLLIRDVGGHVRAVAAGEVTVTGSSIGAGAE